tara:strand:+ start:560 stop:775 length:216 start_codon:yes stop_codon:yes gene_type:complete
MLLAGSGGIYEILLIILVVILIFNGLKRQKILNTVDSNLYARNRNQHNESTTHKKEKLKEVDYIDFEETSE